MRALGTLMSMVLIDDGRRSGFYSGYGSASNCGFMLKGYFPARETSAVRIVNQIQAACKYLFTISKN